MVSTVLPVVPAFFSRLHMETWEDCAMASAAVFSVLVLAMAVFVIVREFRNSKER